MRVYAGFEFLLPLPWPWSNGQLAYKPEPGWSTSTRHAAIMAAVQTSCGCTTPFVGPSLEGTCGAGSFVVFMGLLDNFLRTQCDLNDPCGRVGLRSNSMISYDFVVIGGGSAGAVVASRLSEVPEWNVLLLEAGGDEPPGSQVPSMVINFHGTELDWKYHTEPQANACLSSDEQRCKWVRGKVLGGSSVLNGMMYMRGHPRDYDKWAEAGITGWGYQDVLPYFKKSEDNLEVNEVGQVYHGVGGPLTVTRFPHRPAMADSILQAGQELGYPINPDINGAQVTGFTVAQTTSRNGSRLSSARAFLRPARDRQNLHVLLNSTATKILLDNNKQVKGVEFIRNGRKQTVRVGKELVLSGGAINSPQLLLLSGIGPKEELVRAGVPLVHDLPGVGRNLQNHVAYSVNFIVNNETDVFDLDWASATEYMLSRTGPMSSTGLSQLTAKVNSQFADPSGNDPDVQFFFSGYLANCARTGEVRELMSEDKVESKRNVQMTPVVLHPKSRGYLTLRSSNFSDHPLMYANYFSNYDDMKTLIEGVKIAVKLGETRALREGYGLELDKTSDPACTHLVFGSDQYWECTIRQNTAPENHQVGSCSMGPEGDPNAVVDPLLRLQGVKGVRVADASVIPVVVSGNTNAPAIMIGERVVDMIKSQWAPNTADRFGGDDTLNTVTPGYFGPPYGNSPSSYKPGYSSTPGYNKPPYSGFPHYKPQFGSNTGYTYNKPVGPSIEKYNYSSTSQGTGGTMPWNHGKPTTSAPSNSANSRRYNSGFDINSGKYNHQIYNTGDGYNQDSFVGASSTNVRNQPRSQQNWWTHSQFNNQGG